MTNEVENKDKPTVDLFEELEKCNIELDYSTYTKIINKLKELLPDNNVKIEGFCELSSRVKTRNFNMTGNMIKRNLEPLAGTSIKPKVEISLSKEYTKYLKKYFNI